MRDPDAYRQPAIERIPTEAEAREIALAMNLRGGERERFLAAAREAREALIALEVARKRGGS